MLLYTHITCMIRRHCQSSQAKNFLVRVRSIHGMCTALPPYPFSFPGCPLPCRGAGGPAVPALAWRRPCPSSLGMEDVPSFRPACTLRPRGHTPFPLPRRRAGGPAAPALARPRPCPLSLGMEGMPSLRPACTLAVLEATPPSLQTVHLQLQLIHQHRIVLCHLLSGKLRHANKLFTFGS